MRLLIFVFAISFCDFVKSDSSVSARDLYVSCYLAIKKTVIDPNLPYAPVQCALAVLQLSADREGKVNNSSRDGSSEYDFCLPESEMTYFLMMDKYIISYEKKASQIPMGKIDGVKLMAIILSEEYPCN